MNLVEANIIIRKKKIDLNQKWTKKTNLIEDKIEYFFSIKRTEQQKKKFWGKIKKLTCV